jgi:hypothetical protein
LALETKIAEKEPVKLTKFIFRPPPTTRLDPVGLLLLPAADRSRIGICKIESEKERRRGR